MIDIDIPPIIINTMASTSGVSAGQYVLLAALIGAVAAVVGQVVSAIAQHFTQRRRDAEKLAQERAVRWDDRMRDVAARYIGATFTAVETYVSGKRVIDAISRRTVLERHEESLNAALFSPEMARRISEREIAVQGALEPVRQTQGDANALLAELLMIAPREVGDIAKELWNYTTELMSTATDKTRAQSKNDWEIARGKLITTVAAVLQPEISTNEGAADASSPSDRQGS